jgi:hypothetical protein
MALVFDNKNIRVDFLSEAFNGDINKFNTKTILFPVLRYKIYAPSVEEFKLNIFQKTVLSIINKGNFEIQKISEWLKLDIQLIQMIMAELNQKGYANNGVITVMGREVIENTFSWFNNTENIKKDIYYIYQDIYTKKLYPVLMKLDSISDTYEYENKKIKKTSKGKTFSIHVNLIEPRGINLNNIQRPEINEIFEIIQEQSKQTNNKDNSVPPNLIKYLDSEATLSYLSTTLYIENTEENIEDFKVLDPFRIEDVAYWLKDNLYQASNFNNYLKSILESLVIDAKEEKELQLSDALKKIHKEATEKVDNTFSYNLKMYDKLYKSLEEFYMDINSYDSYQNGKYLKEAFKDSQTILETLFDYIYRENKSGYLDAIKVNKELNNLDKDIVKTKIIKMSPNTQLPQWRFKRFNGLKQAMNNKAISLRARYISAILASWYDKNNPMLKMMNEKTNLLIFIESITDERNGVAHIYKDVPEHKMSSYYNQVVETQIGIEEIINIFLKGK